MATEKVFYLTYLEAVGHPFELMMAHGENRFGVDSPDLIEACA